MLNEIARFDWDAANLEKCRKHGASIAANEDLLAGDPRIATDPKHSLAEQRFIAIGRNAARYALPHERPVFRQRLPRS